MPEDGDAAAGLLQQIVNELAQKQRQEQQQQQQQHNESPSSSPAGNAADRQEAGEPMDIDQDNQQQQHSQLSTDTLQREPNLLATLVSVIPTVGSLAATKIPTVGPPASSSSTSSSTRDSTTTDDIGTNLSVVPRIEPVTTAAPVAASAATGETTSEATTTAATAAIATVTTATIAETSTIATSVSTTTAPSRSYSGKPFHPDDIFCLGCCRNLSVDHYTCPNTGRVFKSCHACRRKSRLNSKKAVKQKTVPVKECISVDEFCKRLKDIEALQSQETQTLDVMVLLDGSTEMDVESLKARGSRIANYVYESTGYWFSHSRTNEETQSKTRLKIYGCSQRQDRKAPPAPKNHTKKRNRQSTKVYFDCKGSLTMTFHEAMNQVRVMYSHRSHAKYDNRKCPDHIRQYIKDNLSMMPKDIHDELKRREPDLTVTQAQVRYWSHYYKKNLDHDGDANNSDGGNSPGSSSSSTIATGSVNCGTTSSSVKVAKISASTSSPTAATLASTSVDMAAGAAAAAAAASTVAMMGLGSGEHDAHSQLQRLAAQTQAENGSVPSVVRDLTPPQATALLLTANGGLAHGTTPSPHHHNHHHHVEQLVAGPLTLPSDVVASIPQSVFATGDVKEIHSHLLSATMAAVAQQHSGEGASSASASAAAPAHDSAAVVQEVNAILKETDVEQRIQQMLEEQQRQEQERAARQT